MFYQLYSYGLGIFNTPDTLLSTIPRLISSTIYASTEIELKGNCLVKKPFDDLNIIVIKDTASRTMNELMLLDLTSYIVNVIPNSITYDEFDHKIRIKILRQIYEYWIGIIRQRYPNVKGSIIWKVFNISPLILTLQVISQLFPANLNLEDFITEQDNISIEDLRECLSYSVQKLLDENWIVSIIK